jgi:hypothetical protein
MERITKNMLDMRVEYLNKITNSPAKPYQRDARGKLVANPGNFHLDGAYGGYSLCRMSTTGGGCSDVFSTGHMPKRELFEKLCAFIQGIEFHQYNT